MYRTYRQIEDSRNRRLWVTEVVMPTVALILTASQVPSIREWWHETYESAKRKVVTTVKTVATAVGGFFKGFVSGVRNAFAKAV